MVSVCLVGCWTQPQLAGEDARATVRCGGGAPAALWNRIPTSRLVSGCGLKVYSPAYGLDSRGGRGRRKVPRCSVGVLDSVGLAGQRIVHLSLLRTVVGNGTAEARRRAASVLVDQHGGLGLPAPLWNPLAQCG